MAHRHYNTCARNTAALVNIFHATFNSLAAAAACSAPIYCSESIMFGKVSSPTFLHNKENILLEASSAYK
jgi:hypothetical protein